MKPHLCKVIDALEGSRDPAANRCTRLAVRLMGVPGATLQLWGGSHPFQTSGVGPSPPEGALSAQILVGGETVGALLAAGEGWDQELAEELTSALASELELRVALRSEQDRRALLETLVENVADAVLAADAGGTFLISNAAARAIFAEGADAGAPLPSNWSAMHRSRLPDGTFLAPEQGALSRAMRGHSTDGLVFTLQRSDDTPCLWVEARGRPILDSGGTVVAAIAIYRDVTRQHHQLDVYRALLENIPRAAVALFDLDLRCVAIGGQMAPPWACAGPTMRQLARAEGDERFDVVEALYRHALAGESLSMDYTLDGHKLALHTAPVKDELGRITGGIVLAFDVTTERDIETKLRSSEQINRAILENLPNGGATLVDTELRYISAEGPAIAELLRRRNLTHLVGHRVPEAGNPEMRELYERTLRGERCHKEVEANGLVYEVNTVPIFFDGNTVSHALACFYDVTERKRERDQTVRASSAKSAFLINMSHELRTPMNAIIGFSEMLADEKPGPLNPRQSRYVANILNSGRHLLALINELLDLAKIEAGKMELELSPLSIADLLRECEALIAPMAAAKSLRLTIAMPADLPPVSVDRIRVKQVFINILNNAVKFTQPGGAVTVTGQTGEGCVELRFADTGVGIKEEDRERVFRKFEQTESSYARAQEGTGLGLALSLEIMQLHGGELTVHSEGENQGSTFTVNIPSTM